jgi:membrane fusion protein
VLLVPRVSHTVLAGFVALIVARIVGLFAFGAYTRKARIDGWLAPEAGLIEIVPPQSGVLIRLEAEEGLEVAAGAPLAVVSAERQSELFGATRGTVLRQIRAQRDSLAGERRRHEVLFSQQAATLAARLEATEAEAAELEREAGLQRDHLALAERAAERQRGLRDRAIATEQNLLEAEQDALDQALALQALERNRATSATPGSSSRRSATLCRCAARCSSPTDRAIAALEQSRWSRRKRRTRSSSPRPKRAR